MEWVQACGYELTASTFWTVKLILECDWKYPLMRADIWSLVIILSKTHFAGLSHRGPPPTRNGAVAAFQQRCSLPSVHSPPRNQRSSNQIHPRNSFAWNIQAKWRRQILGVRIDLFVDCRTFQISCYISLGNTEHLKHKRRQFKLIDMAVCVVSHRCRDFWAVRAEQEGGGAGQMGRRGRGGWCEGIAS